MLAWRTIGISVRIALEMGLNRRETLIAGFKDKQQRLWANKMFWCVYVLDRRWSFGVGMPFALHDLDIDPDLPEPVSHCLENVTFSLIGIRTMVIATSAQ